MNWEAATPAGFEQDAYRLKKTYWAGCLAFETACQDLITLGNQKLKPKSV